LPRRTSRTTSRCRNVVGGEDGDYILRRPPGESMKDAGILEGDFVRGAPPRSAPP